MLNQAFFLIFMGQWALCDLYIVTAKQLLTLPQLGAARL
jgi:hypothetical protein